MAARKKAAKSVKKAAKKVMKAAGRKAKKGSLNGAPKKRKPSEHAIAFGAAASACHRELKKEGFDGKERFKRVGACVKEKLAEED